MYKLKCLECGKDIIGKTKQKKFCKKCLQEHRRLRKLRHRQNNREHYREYERNRPDRKKKKSLEFGHITCVVCKKKIKIQNKKGALSKRKYCSKKCSRKQTYLNNKTKILNYSKKYYRKNKKQKSISGKNWRNNNKEKCDTYYKKRRKKLLTEENKFRKKHNLPLIGEGYLNETKLFNIINLLFFNKEIIKRTRKVLPNYLELDIYIPELKLAFEYNGKQHYKFVKYFHKTKERFEKQKERDLLKRKYCNDLGIKLIEIPYTFDLTKDNIYILVSKYI